ncbi:MAG: hypothetical protein HYX79_10830 [Chloroflexi bacterium]|nr:hypothetical protein [Chloroflexota bacterium]
MPKSGRSHGKSFKKATARRSIPLPATEQQPAAAPQPPITPAAGPVPAVKKPVAVGSTARARAALSMAPVYPYIRGELKKIWIVATIMLIILIVLASVLS